MYKNLDPVYEKISIIIMIRDIDLIYCGSKISALIIYPGIVHIDYATLISGCIGRRRCTEPPIGRIE
jgi:hypothetical protein